MMGTCWKTKLIFLIHQNLFKYWLKVGTLCPGWPCTIFQNHLIVKSYKLRHLFCPKSKAFMTQLYPLLYFVGHLNHTILLYYIKIDCEHLSKSCWSWSTKVNSLVTISNGQQIVGPMPHNLIMFYCSDLVKQNISTHSKHFLIRA